MFLCDRVDYGNYCLVRKKTKVVNGNYENIYLAKDM